MTKPKRVRNKLARRLMALDPARPKRRYRSAGFLNREMSIRGLIAMDAKIEKSRAYDRNRRAKRKELYALLNRAVALYTAGRLPLRIVETCRANVNVFNGRMPDGSLRSPVQRRLERAERHKERNQALTLARAEYEKEPTKENSERLMYIAARKLLPKQDLTERQLIRRRNNLVAAANRRHREDKYNKTIADIAERASERERQAALAVARASEQAAPSEQAVMQRHNMKL